MATFLQVVGATFLVFLAILVVLGLVIRSKLRKFAKGVLEGVGAGGGGSPRIHLDPADAPTLARPAEVRALRTRMEALGLQPAGVFSVREMPGTFVFGYVAKDGRIAGVVYDHVSVGVWADLAAERTDGKAYTYTTTPMPKGVLDEPPWKSTIRAPGEDLGKLLDRLEADLGGAALQPVTVDGFADFFQKAYAREMDWRNARGGPTELEVRNVARQNGNEEPTPEVLEAVKRSLKEQALWGLEVALAERWAERSGGSVEDAEGLVFVHDQIDGEARERLLETHFGAGMANGTSGSTRERFAQANAEAPRPLARLGDVEHPVPADVYRPREEPAPDAS